MLEPECLRTPWETQRDLETPSPKGKIGGLNVCASAPHSSPTKNKEGFLSHKPSIIEIR
jgi:hypothetical protein